MGWNMHCVRSTGHVTAFCFKFAPGHSDELGPDLVRVPRIQYVLSFQFKLEL
jgi:hypothetical protein